MINKEGRPERAKERGIFLRHRRESLGLRRRDVADIAGVSDSQILSLEKGLVYDPGISTISTFTDGYKLNILKVLELYGVEVDLSANLTPPEDNTNS